MAELNIGSRVCECTACGEFFSAVTLFDKHHILTGPEQEDKDGWDWSQRRCLTTKEMESRGWKKNAYGVWGEGTWATTNSKFVAKKRS